MDQKVNDDTLQNTEVLGTPVSVTAEPHTTVDAISKVENHNNRRRGLIVVASLILLWIFMVAVISGVIILANGANHTSASRFTNGYGNATATDFANRANAAATATMTSLLSATATASGAHPVFVAEAPGCDGLGEWGNALNTFTSCQGGGLQLNPRDTAHPGTISYWGNRKDFPFDQRVGVTVSDLSSTACGGVGLRRKDGLSGGYGVLICGNNTWKITRIDDTEQAEHVLAGGAFSPSSGENSIIALAIGSTVMLVIDQHIIGAVSDGSFTISDHVDLMVEGKGSDAGVRFTHFAFSLGL
jgi:hypothetical protein